MLGVGLCKCVRYLYICVYTVHMSPTGNGSAVLQCFDRGNAIELHNRIMFNFYPGLSHLGFCVISDLGTLKGTFTEQLILALLC